MEESDRDGTWVVIAAFNEGPAIRPVVSDLVTAGWRVVVVDDGSRDDTAQAAGVPGVVVLRHSINRGQGAALQTGIDYAIKRGARQVVTFDADGQHDPEDIPTLLAALADHDVALGSRFLGKIEGASKRRRAMLQVATAVSNRMASLRLTDAHCGLRAFRAAAAPTLRMTQDRMAHASELLRKLGTSELRWTEVPVTVRYTDYSMAKGQSGWAAFRIMFDYWMRT